MRVKAEPQLVVGWGRAAPTAATVLRPGSQCEVAELVSRADGRAIRHFVARGLGRSYGDAAQCAGGAVVDCTRLDRVLELDESAGRLRAESGVSFDSLLRLLVPRGWFLPVTPGTRYVTLGGAIASDVHGKNHHVDGSLAAHLDELRLASPVGPITCGPEMREAEFFATCGGMGLTGVITEAVLRLIPIETGYMRVQTERAKDLDACLALLAAEHGRYRYSVAWVDGLAAGGKLGRAVLTRGDHARLDDLPARARAEALTYGPRQRFSVPRAPAVSLLSPLSMAALNEMWYRKSPRGGVESLQPIAGFFHPLDSVAHWNLLYGRHGFTQYQFVVPFEAEEVISTVLARLRAAQAAPYLAVLKSFGAAGPGYLSFPAEGWTLALDLPLGRRGLVEVLDELDALVAEVGGRVYLSKDGRLRPELIRTMYPRVAEWAGIRDRLDPESVLSSDLGRRLGLCPSAALPGGAVV